MQFLSHIKTMRRNLFTRDHVERDLDSELRAYLDHLTDEKCAAGMNAAEARRAAYIEFGGVEQVKEEVRQVRNGRLFREFLQDTRYGIRTLRRNPTFTVVAVLVLALGIGVNTAMFSVAYGMLFRPLPYPNADRIAIVYMRYFPRDFAFGTMSIQDFLIWRQNNRAFEEPSLFRNQVMDVGGKEGVPEQVQAATVSAGFFPTLSVRPLIGRAFASDDDKPAARSYAVLSESMWRRRFAASSAVLGETILINGLQTTVIGVMPDAFRFPRRDTEVWTNLRLNPPTRFGPWFYRGVARLKPGVTLGQAQAETNTIGLRLMQQNSFYKRLALPVRGLRDGLLGTTLKPAILALGGAVGLVLLIAVVNVANLMLARATARQREMALRLGLGAGRGRLVRQLLTESVLLAGLGGAAGLALGWGGIEVVRIWNPGNLPFIEAVRLDGTALAFAALVSMLTGILFGLAPALENTRSNLNSTIQAGGRGSVSGHSGGRARAVLVVTEIAVSLMLLTGAGLLLRSFVNLEGVTGGFSAPPRRILTMLISPGSAKYRDSRAGIAFYEEVTRRAREVPGVETAAVTDSLPPDRQGDADSFAIEGETREPGDVNPIVTTATIAPGFFETLRIPLEKGRDFTTHDNQDGAPVAIVSEAFARRFFPGREAIGKRIMQSGPGFGNKWLEIVGVVGNVKYLGLTVDSDPAYYIAFDQTYAPRMFLVVRTSGDAGSVAAELRRKIQSIDAGVTLANIGTMEQALNLSVSQPRFDTMLLELFAGIATLLAAAGIYGLIAYSVAQRTHEIGVRMALGAAQTDVLRMVIRQGATLAAVGIGVGLGGAFILTRLLKTMLFGVGATDGLTFAGAPLALMCVVFLATLIPARRATTVSPVTALRYE